MLIDGQPHTGDLVVPASTREHEITVSSPGYVSESLRLVADRSRRVEVRLRPTAARTRGSRTSKAGPLLLKEDQL
jgi:hypothetical protein